MKKALLFTLLSLFALISYGQEITIDVTKPGTLSSLIGDKKYNISNLIIKGSLNGDDIITLRDMAGITKGGSPSKGRLSNLDLSETSIVSGGNSYMYDYGSYEQYYTKQDTLNTYSFYNCPALEIITLPKTLKAVEKMVFSVCPNLKEINVPNENTFLKSVNGVLFSLADSKLLRYPSAYSGGDYTIPNDVKIIGYEAFADCLNLNSVDIPNSVTTIEGVAFTFCKKISLIEIPASVTSISASAFNYCTRLENINVADDNPNYKSVDGVLFNKSMTEILRYPLYKKGAYEIPQTVIVVGEYAFHLSTGLTEVVLPSTLKDIKKCGFFNCSKLTELYLPSKVETIGNSAFGSCANLSKIVMSNGITSLGNWCFAGCKSLENIELPTTLTIFGEGSFSDCPKLTAISIPEGTTIIPASFCANNKLLVRVSLPSTVTNIGDYAFYSCKAMRNLYCYSDNPPICGIYPFYGVDKSKCTLYVPETSIEKYKTDNVFKEFTSFCGIPTNINVTTEKTKPIAIYKLDGQIAPANYSGIVIEVMPNGVIRKTFIK